MIAVTLRELSPAFYQANAQLKTPEINIFNDKLTAKPHRSPFFDVEFFTTITIAVVRLNFGDQQ
jgi:hypothetical protein